MTVKNKRSVAPDSAQLLSKHFADVFQSYLECSDDVQAAVRDMVQVLKSSDATEEEREGALETISDALFPKRDGKIGIDFDEDFAESAPDERLLRESRFVKH